MTAIDTLLLTVSTLLLAWIAFALLFLRDRLWKSRKLLTGGLMVGPAIYAAVLLGLLRQGAAIGFIWISLALVLGGTLAVLRSRATNLSLSDSLGGLVISTSPVALMSIATIAMVQPIVLIGRHVLGRAFDETSVHIWVVVFLFSLSTIYALLIVTRSQSMRRRPSRSAIR